MAAQYKIQVKSDSTGKPLLLVKVVADWELAITEDTLKTLGTLIEKGGDGRLFAKTDEDDWKLFYSNIAGVANVAMESMHNVIGLESSFRQMPMTGLIELIRQYQLEAKPPITFRREGQPPTMNIIMNVGTVSATFPVGHSEVRQIQADITALKECKAKADVDHKTAQEFAELVAADVKIISHAVDCIQKFGEVVEFESNDWEGLYDTCKDVADGVDEAMDAAEKLDRQREQEAREHEHEVESCQPNRDLDGDEIDRVNRTC